MGGEVELMQAAAMVLAKTPQENGIVLTLHYLPMDNSTNKSTDIGGCL